MDRTCPLAHIDDNLTKINIGFSLLARTFKLAQKHHRKNQSEFKMHLRPTTTPTTQDMPWAGFEKYPQGLPNLDVGDDVEEYDRKLVEDGQRLCTDINQSDNMSIDVLTLSSSSALALHKIAITTPEEFNFCFKVLSSLAPKITMILTSVCSPRPTSPAVTSFSSRPNPTPFRAVVSKFQ